LIFSQALTLFTTHVVYLAFDRLAKRLGHGTPVEAPGHAGAPAD
jgi:multidrug efflux pump